MANRHSNPTQQATIPHPSHLANPPGVSNGFTQTLGIHPAIGLFTLCLDAMAFGGEAVSFGAFLPFSLLMAGAVGYVTYKGQQAWYGDSEESAKTKAVMLAVLTFLPTALPSLIYAPLGFVGFFRRKH